MRRARRSSRLFLLGALLGVAVAGPSQAGLGRWTPVGPGGGTVLDLATDPSSPGTLWASTTNGVYKSTDRGITWTWKVGGDLFYTVAVDPDHPSTVYAAGYKIQRTLDGGETWDVVLDGDYYTVGLAVTPGSGTIYTAGSGLRSTDGGKTWKKFLDGDVKQVVVDPSNPRTVYAIGAGSSNLGLWKSTDGGDTWARIGPLAGSWPAHLWEVVVAPSQPGTLYAAAGDLNLSFLYRSTDGGARWTRTGSGTSLLTNATLTVDPDTPSTVYAAGYEGIAVSTDAGAHWTPKESGLPFMGFVWVGTMAFDAGRPRTLYAGMQHFGVARTQDGGEHWRQGLQVGLTAAGRLLEIDPVRPGTFYFFVDGRIFRTTDGGHTWTPFAASIGDVGPWATLDLAVDRFHPATIYAGTPAGIFRSADDGASWTQIDDQRSGVLALADDGNVILSSDCGLRRSADGGRTWHEVLSCSAGDDLRVTVGKLLTLPGRPAAHAVVVVDPTNIVDPHYYLYTSRSHGAFWKLGFQAIDVAVSLAYPATVYAADTYDVLRSEDGGRHWITLDAGMRPFAVAVDPRNPRIVYASGYGDPTVRRSTDGGLTWSDVGDGLRGRLVNAGALYADPTTPGHFFAEDAFSGGVFEATFPSP